MACADMEMNGSARAGRFRRVSPVRHCRGRPARTLTTASRTSRSTGNLLARRCAPLTSRMCQGSRNHGCPLLQEAERRLKAIAGNPINLKASPLLEQVKTLVPWKLQRVQIFRSPKQRRLAQEVLLEGSKHRGAALWFNDDTVGIRSSTVPLAAGAESSSC